MRKTMRLLLMTVVCLPAFLAVAVPARADERWDRLSPQERRELLRNYRAWKALPDGEKARVRRSYERWRAMSPGERKVMRQRWRRFSQLPEDRQERIRQNFRRWQSLSPERRRELRERFSRMSPEERQKARKAFRSRRDRSAVRTD